MKQTQIRNQGTIKTLHWRYDGRYLSSQIDLYGVTRVTEDRAWAVSGYWCYLN